MKEVSISFYCSGENTNHGLRGQNHCSVIFLMPYFDCYELVFISINCSPEAFTI